jgi:hypothetical protein
MRNLISRLYRRETSEEEWRWRRFPPRRSLPPLPPSLPLFHDLTISLLGIKFDLGDPPFASSPDLAIFSCPTERSRCVIFVMAVIIGGRLGPSAGLTGSGCFRSSSMSPCSHTAHLSHLQMFGSSVFHLVPAVAGLSMCMCLATSIFLSWFHRLFYHTSAKSVHVLHTSFRTIPPSSPHRLRHRVAYYTTTFHLSTPVASSSTSVILCLFIALLYLSLDGVIPEAFIYV